MDRIKISKRKLGKGGYGTVWFGKYTLDPKTGEEINAAIKKISVPYMRLQEVKLQAKLSKLPKCSQYVACLYDVVKDSKFYYIVMEYLKGNNLTEYLSVNPRLTSKKIIELFRDILEGLDFIHISGIGHGDIKLENLVIDHLGKHVKFIDFGYGCTKTTCKSNPFFHGTMFLSPPETYVKPKIQKTLESIQAADVWATGITLIELISATDITEMGLSGRKLSKQSSPVDPKIIQKYSDVRLPEDYYGLIAKMIDPNPQRRITAEKALKIFNYISKR